VTRVELQVSVQSILFHPGGLIFAVRTDDKTVRLYESRTGREVGRLTSTDGDPQEMAFNDDGTRGDR